jgi:hypothetical protein
LFLIAEKRIKMNGETVNGETVNGETVNGEAGLPVLA